MIWAVAIGGLATTLNPLLAYLIRAEGSSLHAGIGMILGALLNIVLDPVMILYLGWEIKGASIATMIGNSAAACYFLVYIFIRRSGTIVSLKPSKTSFRKDIAKEVIFVGLPSCCLSLLSTLSNSVTNILVSGYSAVALAGVGIAKKINLTAFALTQGLSQGILPLIGYNYAKGNYRRMRETIKFSAMLTAILSLSCMVIALLFSRRLVGCFIADIETVNYGARFLCIICLAMPTSAFLFICITYFQAIGQKKNPLIISLFRKGTTDVLFMFLLNYIVGLNGILWATPMADTVAVIVSSVLLAKHIKG
jgi:Na+-driven multidrug efflux pump